MMSESLDDDSVSPIHHNFGEVYQSWIGDSQTLAIQKERIEKLIEDNHCLMSTIHE